MCRLGFRAEKGSGKFLREYPFCGRKSFLVRDVSKPSGSAVENGTEVKTLRFESLSVLLPSHCWEWILW